jgi:4-hydroxythreonine-4-phosphate dehydrogenase
MTDTPADGALPAAPLAVSMGDPAGIGPECIAKAWERRREEKLGPFFAVGDPRAVATVWDGPVARIGDPSETRTRFDEALPILEVEDAGEIVPGKPNMPGARCAIMALEMAVGLARSGAAGGVVTGPVAKAELYAIGFTHPGQTEFVAERCGISPGNVAMMLAGPSLRTVCVTSHVALAEVSAMLSIDLVVGRARVVARGLQRDFGIAHPRLAMAGFNPHAGEHGALGREEIDVLIPAIEQLRAEGIDIAGPLAADTMFHPRARARYDAALCCYHDQALIPLKTLHFDEGVNYTLGLPIVRASPDHGTAFELAGGNRAEPGATIAAIRMASEAAERRARAA